MVVVRQLASAQRWVDLTLQTYYLHAGLSICQLLLDQACNGCDQLLNHLRFHYRMVLVCRICAGWGSSSWRTVKGHIEACARQRLNIAEQRVPPGEPLWQSSDNRLRSLTRPDATAMTFKLPVWSNPPDDAELGDQARLITKVLSEMQAQMTAVKEEATEVEASNMTTCSKSAKNSSEADKGDEKQLKSKLKQTVHASQDDQQIEIVDLTR